MAGFVRWLGVLALLTLAGCGESPWNDPYPPADAGRNILYSSFSERPKHLDPVRAYNSNEYEFIAQIYEPPLQYHYLKRPYQLTTLTAQEIPRPRYFDAEGVALPDDAPADRIAFSEYELKLRPEIRYQPHPALARDAKGAYRYHHLPAAQIAALHTLTDLPEQGSRAVTAADYLYQVKRQAAPWLHCPIAGLMGEYIVGFDAFSTKVGAAYDALKASSGEEKPFLDLRSFDLEGVQAPDDHTLRIRLRGKYPQFVYWLAMPFFAPMPWEAEAFYNQPGMEKRNITLDWFPIGSGAFLLSENNPNLRMVLERNPNYHDERYPEEGDPGDAEKGLLRDAGRPLPFLEKAVYNLEKEDIPYWNKFLQGYYDVSGVTSDSFDQAITFSDAGEAGVSGAMAARGIGLVTAVTASVSYLGFNWLDPVVGGDSERARLLRQAISIAVDYEEYITIFANGRGVPAQSPIPPGIFSYREGPDGINPVIYDLRDGKPQRKPIAAAQALLAQAGYPEGRDAATGQPLILNYDVTASGPDDKARLDWMRKQFKKLGIELVIRATDYNRFQEKMREGKAQIYMWGWNADYPDPENFLFLLYGPNAKVDHDGENASNYRNAAYDTLFEQMKSMENGPERQAIINEMVAILRHDAPWAWGFHPKGFSLYHAWYSNVKPNLMANNTLKYKRVDPALRAERQRAWNPPILWPLYLLLAVLALSVLPAYRVYRRRERGAQGVACARH